MDVSRMDVSKNDKFIFWIMPLKERCVNNMYPQWQRWPSHLRPWHGNHMLRMTATREKETRFPKVLSSLDHLSWHFQERKINFIFFLSHCVLTSLSKEPNLESYCKVFTSLLPLSVCMATKVTELPKPEARNNPWLFPSLSHFQYQKYPFMSDLPPKYF